jgi:tetratricopeptide (TPR) repeat protein
MNRRIIFFFFTGLLFLVSCTDNKSAQAKLINEQGLKYHQEGEDSLAQQLFVRAANMKGVSNEDKASYYRNAAISTLEIPDSARYFFSKAKSLNKPNAYEYLVNNAYIHLIDKKVDAAITDLKKAYQMNKEGLAVNNMLGLIYLGEYGKDYFEPFKAIKFNFQSFELYKDDQSKFVLAKNYYYIGRYNKALTLFEQLYASYPNDTDYLITLIMMHQENRNTIEAEKLMETLKDDNPERYQQFLQENSIIPGKHTLVWFKQDAQQ